jgi:hypothetical protein
MKEILVNYFRASFPCIAIQTTEEARACADVITAAKSLKRGIVTWSATEGLIDVGAGGKRIPDTEDLRAACALNDRKDTIFIFRDVQTWAMDRDPVLCRAFRDFVSKSPELGCSVVLLGPEYKPHSTIEKMVVILDYNLPSVQDLKNISSGISESAKKPQIKAGDDVIRALGGLNTTEAENALSLSLIEKGDFDPGVIYREKTKAVKKSGLLDIAEADPRGLDAIGGLDVLKSWIKRRRRVWSDEARDFGLPQPKGILLIGVPGTGKSLSAKSIGTALGVPTLRLDVGNLFNSLVGESEARTRDALKLAEALAPCVLWIDEIDKGMAGSSGSGGGDSGVTKRVFGSIISWMQERRRSVFMVATANDVTSLPPELLRKGRFDEIFAVDLPSEDERKAILAIHLKGRKRDPKKFDLEAVAGATDTFTGSEIEACLDEGLFAAFDAGGELETEHLLEAARSIVPLATTAKEQIEGIRAWAKSRARFASTRTEASPTTTKTRRLME